MSSNSYFRDVVIWRKAKVKMDRGDHWLRDYASPSFVLPCWGMPYRYLTKQNNTTGSIFCAHVFCSNFDWYLDWIAAPTPLHLGPDQTLCDISRRFPRRTECFLRVMNLRKQSGSAIFNPDFHLLVLASWLTAAKASPETITQVLSSDRMWEHKHLCVLCDYNLPHFFVLLVFHRARGWARHWCLLSHAGKQFSRDIHSQPGPRISG